jgi:hypothetical protein
MGAERGAGWRHAGHAGLLILVLGAVACGEHSSSDGIEIVRGDLPPWTSGSLLHALVATVDGASTVVGVYDAVMRTSCGDGITSDGAVRCVPVHPGHAASWTCSGATCSAFSEDSVTPRLPDGTLDPNSTPFWEDRAEETRCGASSTYYASADTSDAPGEAPRQFRVVDPTAFVALTEKIVSDGGRIGKAFAFGDDGSKRFEGLVDMRHGHAPCNVHAQLGSDDVCVPAAGPSTEMYADSACTSLKPIVIATACGEAPAAVSYDGAYYALGAKVTGDVFFIGADGVCQRRDADGTWTGYELGAQIPPADFPRVTFDMEGTGRVLSKRVVSETGTVLMDEGFFDTKLQTDCHMDIAGDGHRRCLPYGDAYVNSTQLVYLDDQCMAPMMEVDRDLPPDGTRVALPIPSLVAGDDDRLALYSVSATQVTTAQLWVGMPGDCRALDQDGRLFVPHVVLKQIAPTEFERVELSWQ